MNFYKTIESFKHPTLEERPKTLIKKSRNIPRPQSSLNQITQMNVYQRRNLSPNQDLLKLIIETSPTKYDLSKIKKKMEVINPLFTERVQSKKTIDELYYKYNILYGSNTNQLIRTYSPKMRPVSSSIQSFKTTLLVNKNSDCKVFTDDEVDELLQAKTKDLYVEYREEMRDKFNDYCRNKCCNRRVNFTDCYIGLNFISVLSRILYATDKIAILDLTQNNLGDTGIQILCNAIQSSISLVMLNVTSNNITHKGGDSIFQMLIDQSSIISVNISSIEGVNRNRIASTGLRHIVQVLKSNSFIEDLNIGGNSIKNEGLKLLAEGLSLNTHLHYINISNNDISTLGINSYFDQIKGSKIMELNLSSNSIKNEGLIKVTNCLGNFTLMKKLNVANCDIDFKGFYYLITNLLNVKRLEALDISENDLSTNHFSSIKTYFQQCGIKYLNMSKCNLGNRAGYALGLCLCVNDSIRKIELRNNKIADQGFVSFIPLPKVNSTLESFVFSKNFISDTAKDFIMNLANNKTMKHINMYDNQLKNESGTAMIDVLGKNRTIINVNLVFNRIQLKLIDEINGRVNINVKRSKRRMIPDLIQDIKTLQFNPDELDFLRQKIIEEEKNSKILEAKIEEETQSYEAMKADDDSAHQEANLKNKEIEDSITPLNEQLKRLINETKMNQSEVIKKREFIQKEIEDVMEEVAKQKAINEELNKERNEVILGYEVEYNQMNLKYKLAKEKANLTEISLRSIKNDLAKKEDQLSELEKKLAHSSRTMSRRQSRGGYSPRNVDSPSRRKSLMKKRESIIKMPERMESNNKAISISPQSSTRKITSQSKGKGKGKSKSKSKSKGKLKIKTTGIFKWKVGDKGKMKETEGNKDNGADNEDDKAQIIKLIESGENESKSKSKITNSSSIYNRNTKPMIPILNVKSIRNKTIETTKQTITDPNTYTNNNLTTVPSGSDKV